MSAPIPRDAPKPELLPDEEIVRRVRAGERDLYELLLRRHNQRVYRAIRSVLRDEVEVEDVMQQAYVLAYVHLDQFAGLARFSTWLVRIAINEALARARAARAWSWSIDDGSEEAEAPMSTASGGRTPEQELEQRELVLLVERAIDELPEMYRTVMVLREIEGLSTAEVARGAGHQRGRGEDPAAPGARAADRPGGSRTIASWRARSHFTPVAATGWSPRS